MGFSVPFIKSSKTRRYVITESHGRYRLRATKLSSEELEFEIIFRDKAELLDVKIALQGAYDTDIGTSHVHKLRARKVHSKLRRA